MTFLEKKEHLKQEIQNIAKESYNKEQKALATYILDHATEENIDSIYTFITQRVKLGFTFDAAPEVNHNCVSICKKNENMSFGGVSASTHKLIIGENYDVLKNLLVSYTRNGEGLVDVIYIDPPYNTEKTQQEGNDCKEDVAASKFVYRDKFTRTGWLNMMRERLVLARKLLSLRGVIFISIDDNMQAYLKVLCDEIFGEQNFVSCFPRVTKKGGKSTDVAARNHDYIIMYAKNINNADLQGVLHNDDGYSNKDEYFEERGYYKLNQTLDYDSLGYVSSLDYPIEIDGEVFYAGGDKKMYEDRKKGIYERADWGWRWRKELFLFGYKHGFIEIKRAGKRPRIYTKTYQKSTIKQIDGQYQVVNFERTKPLSTLEFTENIYSNDNATKNISRIIGKGVFDYSKPPALIKKLITLITGKNSIILDFFAGSGTTGQAVMELNEEDGGHRQCILVTNNENNIGKAITYERLYRVVNGKGSKGERVEWSYSKEKPYLSNNYWDVFEIERHKLKIDDYEKAKQLLLAANVVFKQLNPDYEPKHDWDIYNQLASLKPYLEDEKGDSYAIN